MDHQTHLDIPENDDDELDILGTIVKVRDWLFHRDIAWQNTGRVFWIGFLLGAGATIQRVGWAWDKVLGEALVVGALFAAFMYLANTGLIDVIVAFSYAIKTRIRHMEEGYIPGDYEEEYEEPEVEPQEFVFTRQPPPTPTFIAPEPVVEPATPEQHVNGSQNVFRETKLERHAWYQNLKRHSIMINGIRYLTIAGGTQIEIPNTFDERWIVLLALHRYVNRMEAVSGRILEQQKFADRRSEELKQFMYWLEQSNLIERGRSNLMQFSELGNVIFLPHPNLEQAGA